MDDRHDEPAVTEIVASPPATQYHALAAQSLATQAHALAVQAHVLTAQVQSPATQGQALATQANALAAQAQVLAAQVQPPATQAHDLAAQAQVLADQALVASKYVEDDLERSVHAYKEIAILQDINLRYPFHKLALEDWERREEFLRSSVSRREGQSNDLTNQIYSIFGVFAVFQGVVLSAVSQLKQTAHPEFGAMPVCGKIWFPIVLTGFATIATLVGIVDKFMSLHSLETTIHKEKQSGIEVAQRAQSLRLKGPQEFKFNIHADNCRLATNPKLAKKWFLVIAFFVIFTGICILSYFVILCDTWVYRKWDKGLHR